MSWLAGYGKDSEGETDNLGVDWVLQYEFADIGRYAYTWPAAATDDRQIKQQLSGSSEP